VLRADRNADAAARRRLIQEARTASVLNHPDITTVHDVVEADGMQCIVMEFVAGRPLGALIRARLDLDEALRIAVAIADGLARAHAAGVIHRDLKPANVVDSHDGIPKVLDFGIAKLVEEPASAAANDTAQTEETGVVPRLPASGFRGTPGYMAPEQISGGTVDARSDIFSFGALLYEMINGARAFAGAQRSPRPWAPSSRFSRRCRGSSCRSWPRSWSGPCCAACAKSPSAASNRSPMATSSCRTSRKCSRARRGRPSRAWPPSSRMRLVVAGAGLLLGIAALVAWWPRPDVEPTAVALLSPLTTMPGIEASPTFSPDGRQFAYAFDPEPPKENGRPNFDLWVQMVGGSDARRLTSDDNDELAPSWSPDGRWIAYLRGRVGETHGPGGSQGVPAWSPDGSLVHSTLVTPTAWDTCG
jgi:eukaryotic-like serine/threonine-protein kinase